jgi:UDP-glucose 4-epimerase
MTVLVTGGAGYVGSHAVLALHDNGTPLVVLDDLSEGRRELVPEGVPLIEGSVANTALVRDVIGRFAVKAVMHFAACANVRESTTDPLKYFRNNVTGSLALIEACVETGVADFIFSSSCAVYGQPDRVPIGEDTPPLPVNPYGASKLMTERMLADARQAHGLRVGVLRYFNVAGADPHDRAGEWPRHSIHLLKIVCEAVTGRRPGVTVFGADYPTPDGTCVRDYVHVSDIAAAHLRALQVLRQTGTSFTVNCGLGRGHSVLEVIDATQRVAGRSVDVTVAPRRGGEPAALVASAERARQLLQWEPKHDLESMVRTALAWEQRIAGREDMQPARDTVRAGQDIPGVGDL